MKVYVTGGTGLVGSNFIQVATERHSARVFNIVHRFRPPSTVPYEFAHVDMRDRARVLETVRDFKPDAVVHAAIVNDLRFMYRRRREAWEAMVEATRYLAQAARDVGAKMVLVSTDWVFDGTQGLADETTPPNPLNYYGVMKLAGETLVRAMAPDSAVARTAGVFGVQWARPDWVPEQNAGFGGLANLVVERLERRQPFTLWTGAVNARATPTLASDTAEMIWQIIERDGRGIFHCCGGQCVSRRELARTTADVFGLDAGLIREGPVDPEAPESLLGIPVPRDTCLDATHTAERLGFSLPGIREALETFRSQRASGEL
jgi:dTDP-4-dehydrorhamnose reductase